MNADNLHHADGTETIPQRIERKFFVAPVKIAFARSLLRQFCRPDGEYPSEQINSLYFDSSDLEQHLKSASGDYRKNKIRIRWYHTLDDYKGEVPVFVELKSREGFASSKQRCRIMMPVDALRPENLSDGIIPMSALTEILAGFGYFPTAPVHPVIVISYWRYRFTEMFSGMRVALDTRIRSTMTDRSLGFGERELPLAGGVIEVKGDRIELPVTLRKMSILDLDWSRFSKYSSCLDTHMEKPGTVSRVWPPGRTPLR